MKQNKPITKYDLGKYFLNILRKIPKSNLSLPKIIETKKQNNDLPYTEEMRRDISELPHIGLYYDKYLNNFSPMKSILSLFKFPDNIIIE